MDKKRLLELAGVPLTESAEPVEKVAIGHVDDEKHMLRKELYNIAKYAQELDAMLQDLPDNADFPQWWQSKIILSNKCISKAKHYLEGELAVPEEEPADDEIEFATGPDVE